jgi:hypothetical protein
MGWRLALKRLFRDCDVDEAGIDEQELADMCGETLTAMPPGDRLALARELLPKGWVVAREVGEMPDDGKLPADAGEALANSARIGWNACRAAMLGEGE